MLNNSTLHMALALGLDESCKEQKCCGGLPVLPLCYDTGADCPMVSAPSLTSGGWQLWVRSWGEGSLWKEVRVRSARAGTIFSCLLSSWSAWSTLAFLLHLLHEQLLILSSSEQLKRRQVEVMPWIKGCLFCAFVLRISKRRQVCIAGERGEVRRHMVEWRQMSIPKLTPSKLEWLLFLQKLLWSSAVPSQSKHQEIPGSYGILSGVVPLCCHLPTSCLPPTTLNWVLQAQNLNKYMGLLTVSNRGCQYGKIICIDLYV